MSDNRSMAGHHDAPGLALGRDMTVEFYDCDPGILADVEQVKQVFLTAAERSGATVVDAVFHAFEPQGVSGVVVISESHFAVHAWPEHDYAAVDLFTCGDSVDFDRAIAEIRDGLHAGQWIVSSMMNRGIVGNNGVERLVPVTEGREFRYSLSWRTRFESTRAAAISACVDVYCCRSAVLDDAVGIEAFAMDFAATLLPHQTPGRWRLDQFDEDRAAGLLPLSGGFLAMRFDRRKRTAYLDVFSEEFFEPREIAEFAMIRLEGEYYRLQPHIR